MKKIKIIWLSDTYDCDTCGTSWASGAEVWVDNTLLFKQEPTDNCYNSISFT